MWDLVYDKLGIHTSKEKLSRLFSDDVTTSKPFGENNENMFESLIYGN